MERDNYRNTMDRHSNRGHRHRPYDPNRSRGRGAHQYNSPRPRSNTSGSPRSHGEGNSGSGSPSSQGSASRLPRDASSGGRGRGRDGGRGPPREPGAKRERQPRIDIVRHNPLDQNNGTKEGKIEPGDRQVTLFTNYFDMSIRNWEIFQYAVTFDPEIELTRLKKALLWRALEEPRAKIFDGAVLRTHTRIPEDKHNITFTSREGVEYKITLKFTKIEGYLTAGYHQVLNILVRQIMEKLSLQQIGRNFYDPVGRVSGGFITILNFYYYLTL